MFISGGVEDNRRRVLVQCLIDPSYILHVTDDAGNRQVFKFVTQRLLNLVLCKFILLEQHQHRRLIGRDLATKLGANGATRTSHHHNFVGEQIVQASIIQGNWLALDQIFK